MAKSNARDRIVSAAADRFHALGYAACGVKEIVERAAIPKGSFYNYFKAKEHLAQEVLDGYWTHIAMDALADEAEPPLVRLRHHFEDIAGNYAKWGYERGCLVGKFLQEASDDTPLIRRDLETAVTRWMALVATAIEAGQADGSIDRSIAPAMLSRYLVNAWGGAASCMKIVGNRVPLDDFFAVTFDRLLPSSSVAGSSPPTHA